MMGVFQTVFDKSGCVSIAVVFYFFIGNIINDYFGELGLFSIIEILLAVMLFLRI